MLIELKEALSELAHEQGVNYLDSWLSVRAEARRFVRSMPTSEVAIELKTSMHRNAERARSWLANDVIDIDALSLAMPYCDIVVTEQHASHVLEAADFPERLSTILLRDLKKLPVYL